MLAMLLALLFAAAVVGVIIASASNSPSAVQFRHVVAHDAQQALTQVQKIIGDYSK